MLDNLARDFRHLREVKNRPFLPCLLESLLFENGFQAVILYRISHWFRSRGIPFFGPLFARLGLFLTGADISPAAEIGPGLRIAHGVGLVVGGGVRVGSGAVLLHGVTLGARSQRQLGAMPVLGNDVFLGAGAGVFGPVRVGNGVFVGAGAIVTADVPDDSKVICQVPLEIVTRPAPPPASR